MAEMKTPTAWATASVQIERLFLLKTVQNLVEITANIKKNKFKGNFYVLTDVQRKARVSALDALFCPSNFQNAQPYPL